MPVRAEVALKVEAEPPVERLGLYGIMLSER